MPRIAMCPSTLLADPLATHAAEIASALDAAQRGQDAHGRITRGGGETLGVVHRGHRGPRHEVEGGADRYIAPEVFDTARLAGGTDGMAAHLHHTPQRTLEAAGWG